MVEGTPPGDALPPPPQRATPAGKGARCGAIAGSTRPHRPHPGHTGRGTLAARSRGRAAGGGTAPDTRRPSQRWQAPPLGPPFRHANSEQRRPARAHAVGPQLGPHARTDRTRDTRVPEPWLPAPEDGRPGEGQRLTPAAPHNGGRPPPPGDGPPPPPRRAAPTGHAGQGDSVGPPHPHTGLTARGWRTPTARPVGGQSGKGQRLTSDAPHTIVESTPPGDALPPPPQRATPARKGARCGAGAGSPRPHRPHPGHTGRGTLAACSRGRAAGGGTAPDTRRPSQQWQATPPGDDPPPPPRHAAPTGHAGQGDSVGSPHPHSAHSTWVVAPTARPVGGQSGEGERLTPDAPRNSGRHPPRGRPRHPHNPKPSRGEPGPDRPPPSTPDGARDRGRTRGGARTTWNGPTSAQCRDRPRCARHTTQGGGERTPRERERTHTHTGHAGTTRRATGPSSRNAQTAWNGVPASEGKGHPDGTTRHTQRGTRGAGRGKRERHNTRYRPEPPEAAASAAHTPTGHCTRQGSSGALRHAPTPRLGSLCASPRGSHWRQASSTGPAAPAPRATTH